MKLAVLACNGVDKPEGSLAREVGLQVAERTGADLVCPVLLGHAPARYKKALRDASLVVVDGCGTRCASKLVSRLGLKLSRRVMVSEIAKAEGERLEASHRLGAAALALAARIAQGIAAPAAAAAPTESAPEAPAAAAARIAAADWPPPADFFVVVFEKFEFRIPKEGYWFSENDTWVRVAGTRARVGISDFLQQQLTDIVYFDPPKIGARVEQFGELGEVESSKAIFEIIAPVSGTVVAVNERAVEESPELVNADPYGEGWLAEVELSAWAEDGELLLDGAAYADSVGPKASAY